MMRWAFNAILRRHRSTSSGNTAFPTSKEDREAFAVALVETALEVQRKKQPHPSAVEALLPMARILINQSRLFVRQPGGQALAVCQDFDVSDWGGLALSIMRIVIAHLPADIGVDGMGVEVEAWSLATKPHRLIEDLAGFMLAPKSPARGAMWPWVQRLEERAAKAKSKGVEIELLPDLDAWPRWKETPSEVMDLLFRATPFREMLSCYVPISIPDVALHGQSHGMGGTGTGKTTFSTACLHGFVGDKGMLLFDTKGGLAERMVRHSDKPESIIHIDAADPDMRPMFNIAQPPVGTSKDKVASMIQFVLAGLAMDMTDQQFADLEMIAKMVSVVPGATIKTFVEFMESDRFIEPYLDALPEDARAWYRSQYNTREMQTRREAMGRKLWKIAGSDLLRDLLGGTENTLNIRALLDDRMTVIVTVNKDIFREYTGLVCRAVLASANSSMWQRTLPLADDLPDWVIVIDEYGIAVGKTNDGLISEILTQGRERRVCLWITHQQFEDQMSSALQGVIMANPNVKFYCNINLPDARRLAPGMGCAADDMLNLPKGEGGYGYFCLWVSGYIQNATRARVKFGFIESHKKMPVQTYRTVVERYRTYWTGTNAGAKPALTGDVIPPGEAVVNQSSVDANAQPAAGNVVTLVTEGKDRGRAMPWVTKGGQS